MPDENNAGDACMEPWIVFGIFLFGVGAGAITTAALYIEQIRKLKDLLEAAAHNNSQTEEQVHRSDGRRSA